MASSLSPEVRGGNGRAARFGPLVFLVAGYAATRMLARALELTYDASSVTYFAQLLDPSLLRKNRNPALTFYRMII